MSGTVVESAIEI